MFDSDVPCTILPYNIILANIFVSYSHKDAVWKNRLMRHLILLQRHLGTPDDPITAWDDSAILCGDEWRLSIFQAMDEAVVAILLVSVDSLTSSFILNEELPRLLARVDSGALALLPLIVGPCEWGQEERLSRLQARPVGGRPLSAMTDYEVEDCLSKFIDDIRSHIEDGKRLPLPLGNPYKGLYTFEEDDQNVFFGRDAITQQLCAGLPRSPVLCLVGSSGSGKSSLVYAGLVPRLRRDHWLIVPFRPRKDPLDELARALVKLLRTQARVGDSPPYDEAELKDRLVKRSGFLVDLLRSVGDDTTRVRGVLLFVDQFEEVFTNCGLDARREFLNALLPPKGIGDQWAKEHLRYLLTLRFDFLERAVHEREAVLGDILQMTQPQLLGDMSDDQLHDVIERPAELAGASFERGLVERILRDIGVGNERGKLPLLEFCLQQLWIRQAQIGGRVLSRKAYEDIGGFRGAVTQYADSVFNEFSSEEKAAAPALFVHLVNVAAADDLGGDTRRPVSMDELIGDKDGPQPQQRTLVEKLVDKRLLVKGPGRRPDSVTVELAHEILIQAWQRLKEWVDENRDFLKKLRHVETEMLNRQPLSGPLLDECETWLSGPKVGMLSNLAIRYIESCLVDQALAQIRALLDGKVVALPQYIEQLKYWSTVAPMLRERLGCECDHEVRRRLSLALLKFEESPVDYLEEQLLLVEPAEYLVICEALQPYRERFRGNLWRIARAANADPRRQLRAACALARYYSEDDSWADLAPVVAELLVAENPLHIAGWLETLQPVRDRLLGPLAKLCKSPQLADAERSLATTILVDCAAGRTEVLVDVLLEATAKQFALLRPTIQAHRERAIEILRSELAKRDSPDYGSEDRDAMARRQAHAAVSLLHLGEEEAIRPLLRHSPDPARRTYLLHDFGPLHAPVDMLIRALESETDAGVRRALILALGEFTQEQFPDDVRQPLTQILLRWYRDDPDPGIHAAIDWLMRYGRQGKAPRKLDWGLGESLAKIDQELAGQSIANREWYVSSEGFTFAVISGPERFRMGSPEHEKDRRSDETAHLRRISRRFAIASKQVTVAQFAEFQREHPSFPDVGAGAYSPSQDCPQTRVTWFEAAAYCNWLSDREGIPKDQWCYVPHNDNYHSGMKVAANHLSLPGYRLPTEAEWEFSCRARSNASRYFGDSDDLLGLYAWFNKNANDRTWPVGSLKPNDFGLFDMLGNVEEWCQDRFRDYPSVGAREPVEDVEDHKDADNVGGDERVLRGGSFIIFAGLVRSADRDKYRPDDRRNYIGFRPARTCT